MKLDKSLTNDLRKIADTSGISIKEICTELGFTEEELEPRNIDYFRDPHLPKQMAKLSYERYEIGRKGK